MGDSAQEKVVTIQNIGHGQVKRMFEAGMEQLHHAMLANDDAMHEIDIKMVFYKDKEKGQWRIRPKLKVGMKQGQSYSGVDVPVTVNREGIFQQGGEQLRLDETEEED